jgi:hypothetical protein
MGKGFVVERGRKAAGKGPFLFFLDRVAGYRRHLSIGGVFFKVFAKESMPS